MSFLVFFLGFVGLCSFAIFLFLTFKRESMLHLWQPRALVLVSLVAGCAYFLMSLGIGVVYIENRVVYVGRYIEWILTTPLLLFVLLSVGMSKHYLFRRITVAIITLDILMIFFGLVAEFQSPAARPLYFGLSFVFFFILVVLLWVARKYANNQVEDISSLYKILLTILLITWLMYPFVWYVHQTLLVDFAQITEPGMYLFLDIFAKGFFSFLIIDNMVTFRKSIS